mmetsp:Transcript_94467/g.131308  ORF Transcript_94467/g.131308 Transcript_94467/m.131308 type:complete len:240 (-) Transcript_94467:137-856(-)
MSIAQFIQTHPRYGKVTTTDLGSVERINMTIYNIHDFMPGYAVHIQRELKWNTIWKRIKKEGFEMEAASTRAGGQRHYYKVSPLRKKKRKTTKKAKNVARTKASAKKAASKRRRTTNNSNNSTDTSAKTPQKRRRGSVHAMPVQVVSKPPALPLPAVLQSENAGLRPSYHDDMPVVPIVGNHISAHQLSVCLEDAESYVEESVLDMIGSSEDRFDYCPMVFPDMRSTTTQHVLDLVRWA